MGNVISVKLNSREGANYKHGYVLFENVQKAQQAIQRFHESTVFGGRPLQVDFWLSKQELEQEKKQKDQRERENMIYFMK